MSLSNLSVWIAFGLTLCVYSYLFYDTFLYRVAIYIFAGLTAGIVAVVTYDSAIRPWIIAVTEQGGVGGVFVGAVPVILALILLIPPIPGLRVFTTPLRRLTLAFLIGVGAAVGVVGAITGTIIPFTVSTGQSIGVGWVSGIVTIVGVISTLMYFQYASRRMPDGTLQQNLVVRSLRNVGGIFVAITFGTVYAAAIATALTVFSERWGFIISQFIDIFGR